jgi:kynureninase
VDAPNSAPRIAVFGSSTAREGQVAWTLGYQLGRELALAGATVMTGGYGGTMEACSRGAHEAGGHVVGVTVELFEARGPANPFVRERVHTPDLFERLRYLVHHADGFVTLPGSIGTLTELYLTWTLPQRAGTARRAAGGARRHVARRARGAPAPGADSRAAVRARADRRHRGRRRAPRARARGTPVNPAPTGTDDRLLGWREEFPTLEHTLHFISHSLGAMPRGAEAGLIEYTRVWRTRSIRAWDEEWFALPTALGDRVGSIFGAASGSVSMHPNVTSAQAVALSAIDFTPPRNRLVCTAEDFPSVLYLYEGLMRRGVEIVRVPARAEHAMVEADLCAAIDERTALVALSHVLFRTGQVLDLAPVVTRARAMGALTLIDAYQSVGTVPFDVQALDIDLLAGGSVKWLCGGPGASYLYVRPDLAGQLRPAFTGWMGITEPFDFDRAMQWHDGARRFWTGTPRMPASSPPRPGYEIVGADRRAGDPREVAAPDRAHARARRRVRLPGRVAARDRTARRHSGDRRARTPTRVRRAARADVMLDFRPASGLRLAPHFYTRDDEVDEVMKEGAQRGEEGGRLIRATAVPR